MNENIQGMYSRANNLVVKGNVYVNGLRCSITFEEYNATQSYKTVDDLIVDGFSCELTNVVLDKYSRISVNGMNCVLRGFVSKTVTISKNGSSNIVALNFIEDFKHNDMYYLNQMNGMIHKDFEAFVKDLPKSVFKNLDTKDVRTAIDYYDTTCDTFVLTFIARHLGSEEMVPIVVTEILNETMLQLNMSVDSLSELYKKYKGMGKKKKKKIMTAILSMLISLVKG